MLIPNFVSSSLQSKLMNISDSLSRFNLVQKSEAEFIKKVKMKFGDPDTLSILLGDWGGAHSRFHAPSKVKGFRDMFKKAGYQVLLVDEHRTSSTCPDCHERELISDRFRESPRPWRRGRMQKVHGLLRCQSENCQFPLISNADRIVSRYWNRDDVSTLNIRSIVQETIVTGERPLRFSRET